MHRFFFILYLALLLAACSPEAGGADIVPPEPTNLPSPSATSEPPPPAVATTDVTEAAPTVDTMPAAFAPADLRYLAAAFDDYLAGQENILASYTLIDLGSGQEVTHNGDLAISGTSMVKIPILVEVYRTLDEPPTPAETTLITETATLSGNYTANLLLEMIAGRPDAFAGAEQVTRAMRRLSLYNTFIAVPYDEEPSAHYMATYVTPANQQLEPTTNPDSSMQTTTADMARLLQMIYDCRQDTGPLRAHYPDILLPEECAAILKVMSENRIEAFLEEGVPDDVPLAHKHGWVGDTHGDAGLVLAEHPYVIVLALHRPGWLEWEDSTVIIAELSRLAYVHFTDPAAYSPALLATPLPPLPTATPVPDLPLGYVTGTRGAGLTLRDAPGGAELAILPEGIPLYLLPTEHATVGGVSWRQVRTPWGEEGWVGSDYLELPPGS